MPRVFKIFFITLTVSVAFLLGLYFGGHYYRLSLVFYALPDSVRNVFFPGDNILQLQREVEGILEDGFYKPVDSSSLENSAMEGMIKSLDDPYTAYFSPDDFRYFQDHTNGSFVGVGVLLETKDGKLTIVDIIEGSPAQSASIKPGDIITGVDDQTIEGRTEEEAVAFMRGKAETKVVLHIKRGDEDIDFDLTRKAIEIPIISEKMLDRGGKKIGYVRLDQFSLDAGPKVQGAVEKLTKEGAEAIILDLRNNGGGLLDEAVNVGSVFIEDGTIVSVVSRDGKSEVYDARGDANETIPMAVLVNGYTASASEIVAGAIKDDARGKLIGEKTFGKGVVQNINPLSNGGAIKYTSGSYYTPRGIDINKIGIEPDIPAVDDPATPADEVIERALFELAS
ncbi:MAG: S41 family peptidase [Thermoleophilia bacterium]|jgi:carboxyl-terminal processing protease